MLKMRVCLQIEIGSRVACHQYLNTSVQDVIECRDMGGDMQIIKLLHHTTSTHNVRCMHGNYMLERFAFESWLVLMPTCKERPR